MTCSFAFSANIAGEYSYTVKKPGKEFGGVLNIKDAGKGAYQFSIECFAGQNTGSLEFTSTVDSKGNATYSEKSDYDDCLIKLKISNNAVKVDQIKGICGAGMGVDFAGTYKSKGSNKNAISIKDSELCDTDGIIKKYERRLKTIAGKDYKVLIKNLQVGGCFEKKDNEIFTTGNAPHLGTSETAIISIDLQNNKVSAAILTNNQIKYFSEDKVNISNSIKDWKNNM